MKRFAAVAVALSVAILATVPAAAATRDRTKPRVAFTTADNAVLVAVPLAAPAPLAGATTVTGTATDIGGRGIRKVTVTYCANATPDSCGSAGPVLTGVVTARAASVGCTAKNRQRCVWSTPAPATPGTYLVSATAEDMAGNRRSAGPIFITVL